MFVSATDLGMPETATASPKTVWTSSISTLIRQAHTTRSAPSKVRPNRREAVRDGIDHPRRKRAGGLDELFQPRRITIRCRLAADAAASDRRLNLRF